MMEWAEKVGAEFIEWLVLLIWLLLLSLELIWRGWAAMVQGWFGQSYR